MRSNKIFTYFFISILVWNLIIFVFGRFILGLGPDGFSMILPSLLVSYLLNAFPIHFEMPPDPPKGQEYYILFYPIFYIPIIFIIWTIREFLMK